MVNSDILQQALTYLKGLPADSPQWDADVPAFLSSVDDLSKEKAAERAAAASLQALTKEIEELRDKYSEQLKYFELDVSDWVPPANPNESLLAEVRSLLQAMSASFEEHSALPETGASLSETRRLGQQREELAERILSTMSTLDRLLTADDGASESSPESTPEPPPSPTTELPDAPEDSSVATVTDGEPTEGASELKPPSPVSDLDPQSGADTCDEQQDQIDVAATEAESVPVSSDDATLSGLDPTVGELEFVPGLMEYGIELPEGVNDLSVTFKATHASASVTASLQKPDGGIVGVTPSGDSVCEILDLEDGQSALSLVVTAEDGVTCHTYTITLTCRLSAISDHVALMWNLVAQDDLAGAYWLAKSLVAEGLVEPQLPVLLKAVQGARWLSPESSDYVEDLSEIVSNTETPSGDDALVMLGFAASIQPSLVVPGTSLLAWLETPGRPPSIESIVSLVREFANRGHAVGPEHIRGDEWQGHLLSLIAEASTSARMWLEDSSRRRHKLMRATNVWKALCADNGLVNSLLGAVIADQSSELAAVKSRVDELRQEPYRARVIAELDENQRSSPRDPIVGAAREWLHHRIDEAIEQAERWCDLVERANEAAAQSHDQWLSDRVAELRANIKAASQEVLNDLAEIASDSEQPHLASAALCLMRSIHRLLDYLKVAYEADNPSGPPPVVTDLLKLNQSIGLSSHAAGSTSQIEAALSRRLLWITDVKLADDGLPVNSEVPIDLEVAEAEWFSTDVPFATAMRARTSERRSDYRFIDLLRGGFGGPDDVYSTELEQHRQTLTENKERSRDAVNQAAYDGVLEFDGPRWHELTNSHEDIVVESILNFRRAYNILEEIEDGLQKDRINQREKLNNKWETLIRELREDDSRDPKVIDELSDTFALASRDESLDIRVMEDCVTLAGDYLSSGEHQGLVLTRSERSSDTLEDFLRFARGVADPSPYQSGSNLRQLLSRTRSEV